MRINSVKLCNNLMLAPMQKVTTAPFRRFCRKISKIGLVYVPMLYTRRLEKNPNSILKELYKIEQERPISVQLIGGEITALKKSLDYLSSYNYDFLDINAGCPSKRAIKAKEGGFLLKDLEKMERMLDTTTKYSSRPVSVKIRTGYRTAKDLSRIISVINSSNIDFISIHSRTVKDRFDDSKLDTESMKFLKENVSIPVIGNGDINSPIKAKELLDYTKVDGLMIGRAAMGNPKIFTQISTFLKRGKITLRENQINLVCKYLSIYERIFDDIDYSECKSINSIEEIKFAELKRNAIWLTKFIENSKNMRIELSKTKNLKELRFSINNIIAN